MYFLATLSLPPSSLLKLRTISYISEDRKLKRKQKNQEQEQLIQLVATIYSVFHQTTTHLHHFTRPVLYLALRLTMTKKINKNTTIASSYPLKEPAI